MGITDQTAIIAVAYILNYFLIYKKNRFIANVFFFALGVMVMAISRSVTGVGLILTFLAFVNFIYDTLYYQK